MSPRLQPSPRRRRARLLAHLVVATLLASVLVPRFSSAPAAAAPLSINDGDAVNLSNSADRSLSSATASAGSDGYVVWLEEGSDGGITFRALRNNGVSPDEQKRHGGAATYLIGTWVHVQPFSVKGQGRHVVELEVLRGAAFIRGFLVRTRLPRHGRGRG